MPHRYSRAALERRRLRALRCGFVNCSSQPLSCVTSCELPQGNHEASKESLAGGKRRFAEVIPIIDEYRTLLADVSGDSLSAQPPSCRSVDDIPLWTQACVHVPPPPLISAPCCRFVTSEPPQPLSCVASADAACFTAPRRVLLADAVPRASFCETIQCLILTSLICTSLTCKLINDACVRLQTRWRRVMERRVFSLSLRKSWYAHVPSLRVADFLAMASDTRSRPSLCASTGYAKRCTPGSADGRISLFEPPSSACGCGNPLLAICDRDRNASRDGAFRARKSFS
eukprot:TRINITY_DN26693_c0_g5_i1.p1 TRINITY_DN26693_c0_g5~~TRINITY_DN26693_c0_g5_i1.p1  ORF type:complete len:286 (-),score=26.28 TRINITY_DN26693_c0_g5_i1:583-1440(-)